MARCTEPAPMTAEDCDVTSPSSHRYACRATTALAAAASGDEARMSPLVSGDQCECEKLTSKISYGAGASSRRVSWHAIKQKSIGWGL
jgi:hypothetical protein